MSTNISNSLGLTDLRLLMDNYQNIVQMSTILLEQQKQVISLQKEILSKEDNISKTQIGVYNSLNNIADKLDDYIKKFLKLTEDTMDKCNKINDTILKNVNQVESKIENTHFDNTKEHNRIINKVHIGMIASGAVIVSLISLLLTVYEKYEVLAHIQTMLKAIFQKLVG